MKTLRNILIMAVISSTGLTSFVGCKKGDGDPFISFHSRKARVAGKWTLASGTEVSKNTSSTGTSTTTTTTYNGTTVSSVVSGVSGVVTPAPYTEAWEFKKDGTFTVTIIDDGDIDVGTGVWNFTAGVGKLKKKEQIVITILSDVYTPSGGGTASTSTKTGVTNDMTFDIYELKNKEMVWKMNTTDATAGGSSNEHTLEKTYKQ